MAVNSRASKDLIYQGMGKPQYMAGAPVKINFDKKSKLVKKMTKPKPKWKPMHKFHSDGIGVGP